MVKNRCFGQLMDEGDSPGFFKILRKDNLSSEIMYVFALSSHPTNLDLFVLGERAIPLNFIKSISDKEFLAKMVLKVSWGSSWPITISRNITFYYMEKRGWDKFLCDNALGNDEFLTFTHKGNMFFSVDIYRIDSKELIRPRRSVTIASSSCQNKTKVEAVCNVSEDDTSCLVPQFTLTIKKAYLIFLGIPKMFEEMHMPKETTMFKIRDPKGNKSWEVMYKVTGTQSRFVAGWIRFAKELGLVVGDVCTFKLIKPTEMLLKVSKKGLHDYAVEVISDKDDVCEVSSDDDDDVCEVISV